MTNELRITTRPRPGGGPVLAVAGEIDISNADGLRAVLDGCLAEAEHVTVDLTEVGYLDSAGLAVLFPHVRRLELIAPRLLSSVLTVSGLAELASSCIVEGEEPLKPD
jgi:anti-anti-sigma factor